MTMITPSYLGETIEYSSLHACRSTLEDPTAQEIKKMGGKFDEQAGVWGATTLQPALNKALLNDPEFVRRPRVYLSGGAVWAAATLTRPGDRSDYTPITLADLEALEKKLIGSKEMPAVDLAGISDATVRAAAAKELIAVEKVFTRDQILAAVQILKVLAAELKWGSDGKQVVFARNGLFGWSLGYLAGKASIK